MPTNYERMFADRPEAYEAWKQLIGAIKTRMDPRRYELATLAAAIRLKCSYCSLAHGKVLAEQLGAPVRDIAADFRTAGLSRIDVATMELADKVAGDASTIEDADRQPLRDLGLAEEDIFDVVLAASARCFFSKTLDAMGVLPDAAYRELDRSLREVLVVGRPIADR